MGYTRWKTFFKIVLPLVVVKADTPEVFKTLSGKHIAVMKFLASPIVFLLQKISHATDTQGNGECIFDLAFT